MLIKNGYGMTRGDYFCCAHACLGSYCIYSIVVCKNAPFLNLKLILHRIVVEKIKKKKIKKIRRCRNIDDE